MTTKTTAHTEDAGAGQHTAPDDGRLSEAKKPVATAAATWPGIILALLALGAAVLAVQNAITHAGWVGAPSWAGTIASTVDGFSAQWWMIIPGAIAVLVGLWLLVLAVKPRRRTSVRGTGAAPLFVRPVDLARWSSDTARGIPLVIEATSVATRKRVTVRVSTAETARDSIRDQVANAVEERLAPLGTPVSVAVKVRTERVIS